MNKFMQYALMSLFALLFLSVFIQDGIEKYGLPDTKEYTEFLTDLNDHKISKIKYNGNENIMMVYLHNDETKNMSFDERVSYKGYDLKEDCYTAIYPGGDNFRENMLSHGVVLEVGYVVPNISSLWIAGIGLILMYWLVNYLSTISSATHLQSSSNNSETFSIVRNVTTTFDDVIGQDEVIEELKFLTGFIRKRDLTNKLNARTPKGILFTGPPGTGKTLLARAVAGECKTSFIYMNGSAFIEQFVGTGAKRVRELFQQARRNAPCILFIDEIDSIGTSRGYDFTSTEHLQTLNALLQEMDGFNKNSLVLVIAATNHPENLSAALLRAGRFDRQVIINPPDKSETRVKLFEHFFKDKPIDKSVDFDSLARATSGFTGADIEMIANNASLLALSNDSDVITQEDIIESIDKTLLKGNIKKTKVDNDRQKIVAYHEAGHAVCKYLLKQGISRISIKPSTSDVGGFVLGEDDNESTLMSKQYMIDRIKVCYAGRASEEIKFGKDNITIGASGDIQSATDMIHSYIGQLGFDSCGLLDWS